MKSAVLQAFRSPANSLGLLSQLLGRPLEGRYGPEAEALVQGKRVLVTGAAGSIGAEIARQVSQMEPECVFLLDVDESRLHNVQLQLTGSGLLDNDKVVLAGIREPLRVQRLLKELRPDIVYHAAANKHLPILERYPCEAVKTNVLGTHNLLNASLEADVERFILISTDKAADPTSVLGASKRLAETLTFAAARQGGRKYASVRFGNVLGSRGSFLDTLSWQIAAGIPVTVTEPDVTRFFMSIPEAVSLVIEASVLAEQGETYVLDMGDPIRIVDLVEKYAEAISVLTPEIVFTGLRPGEKTHEVLFAGSERPVPTSTDRVSMAPATTLPSNFNERLATLYGFAADDLDAEALVVLGSLVPSYGKADEAELPAA